MPVADERGEALGVIVVRVARLVVVDRGRDRADREPVLVIDGHADAVGMTRRVGEGHVHVLRLAIEHELRAVRPKARPAGRVLGAVANVEALTVCALARRAQVVGAVVQGARVVVGVVLDGVAVGVRIARRLALGKRMRTRAQLLATHQWVGIDVVPVAHVRPVRVFVGCRAGATHAHEAVAVDHVGERIVAVKLPVGGERVVSLERWRWWWHGRRRRCPGCEPSAHARHTVVDAQLRHRASEYVSHLAHQRGRRKG